MGSIGRTFAIGDIHGCYDELVRLIGGIEPQANDTLVFVGDYIDRGVNSSGVLDFIIELGKRCKVIALKGNHESMMQSAFLERDKHIRAKWIFNWLRNGGNETLQSYGLELDCFDDKELLPIKVKQHLNFINSMPTYHITDTHIFVHATPRPDIEISEQDEMDLLWRREGRIDQYLGYNHVSGKTIISGHTPQANGKPRALSDKNIIIDSGCFHTGWLTAMNIDSGEFIQADKLGCHYERAISQSNNQAHCLS